MPKTLRVRRKTGWVTKPIADLPENRLLPYEVDDNFLNLEQQLEDHNNSTTSHPHLVSAVYDAAEAAEQAMTEAILAKEQAQIAAGTGFSDLTGKEGYHVVVNSTETGFDYVPQQPAITSLTGLSDFPSTYSGQETKQLRVNESGTGLEFFSETYVTSLTDLTDFPSTMNGHSKKHLRVNVGGTAIEFLVEPFTLVSGWNGKLTANIVLMRAPIPLPITFPANFSGSIAICEVAPTATTDLSIHVDGVSVGTIRFVAGSTVGSFLTSPSVQVSVNSIVKIVGPATPDATLENLGITLLGER